MSSERARYVSLTSQDGTCVRINIGHDTAADSVLTFVREAVEDALVADRCRLITIHLDDCDHDHGNAVEGNA